MTLEFLRQFRLYNYAIFDFVVSFLGIYLLSPFLSKMFLKIRIDIPKKNWLFLTLPLSIIIHILVGNITPMTRDFLDIHGHYVLKVVLFVLLILGLKGIKIVNKKLI
jgi:hypothetical protein